MTGSGPDLSPRVFGAARRSCDRRSGRSSKQASIDNNPFHTLYPTIEGVGQDRRTGPHRQHRIRRRAQPVRTTASVTLRFDIPRCGTSGSSTTYSTTLRSGSRCRGTSANRSELEPGLPSSTATVGPIPTKTDIDTTSKIDNLHKIEVALWSLEPPQMERGLFRQDRLGQGCRRTKAVCHDLRPMSWAVPGVGPDQGVEGATEDRHEL